MIMEAAHVQEADRLKIVIALLIAVTSVVGAIVAWRGSVAADAAGDSDTAGLRAAIHLNEVRALSAVTTYGDYGAYTQYYRDRQIIAALEADLIALPEDAVDEIDALNTELANVNDQMTVAQQTFPNQFLNRDGSYGLERQQGQIFADAARAADLDPVTNFSEADQFRTKSQNFLIIFSALAVTLVLLTLIEVVTDRLKMVLLGGGSLLLVVSIVGTVLIEMGRLGA